MKSELTRREALKAGAVAMGSLAAVPSLGGTVAMSFDEYRAHDGLALAGLVRKGDVTASELLEQAVARASAVEPSINSIVEELYDRARREVKEGLPAGPFRGVPFLLKDLGMALEGTVTTQGSRFFKDWVADYTSTVVERYQRAGLVIMGKSASPEFGGTATTESILFGDTRNPWNLAHSAGGSSGGSAAASGPTTPSSSNRTHPIRFMIPPSIRGRQREEGSGATLLRCRSPWVPLRRGGSPPSPDRSRCGHSPACPHRRWSGR